MQEAVQLDDDIKTTLVVSREGEFTRGGLEIVDEVFRGTENSLALSQAHSKRFQCKSYVIVFICFSQSSKNLQKYFECGY